MKLTHLVITASASNNQDGIRTDDHDQPMYTSLHTTWGEIGGNLSIAHSFGLRVTHTKEAARDKHKP
jgi:hypothetical protein